MKPRAIVNEFEQVFAPRHQLAAILEYVGQRSTEYFTLDAIAFRLPVPSLRIVPCFRSAPRAVNTPTHAAISCCHEVFGVAILTAFTDFSAADPCSASGFGLLRYFLQGINQYSAVCCQPYDNLPLQFFVGLVETLQNHVNFCVSKIMTVHFSILNSSLN